MKLFICTDIHDQLKYFESAGELIRSADAVVIIGDLTHFGNKERAVKVMERFKRENENVFAVSGNCDNLDIEEYLQKEGVSMHGKAVSFDGGTFIGLGGSLPAPVFTPNTMLEDDIQLTLYNALASQNGKDPVMLFSHQPPYNTAVDSLASGEHVGSKSVRDFIEKYHPMACFSGHIHEALGRDTIKATPCINPGAFKEGHWALVRVQKSSSIEIELY
jgi:hypothetical protein